MSQPLAPVYTPLTLGPETTSSSDVEHKFEHIFVTALHSYKKKTKNNLELDLEDHDLFKQFEGCDSPAAILAQFQAAQFNDPSQTGSDDRFRRWLVPILNVLFAVSVLGAFSNLLQDFIIVPFVNAICAGLAALLLAAKGVVENEDTLIDIFECIESFFVRLEIYTTVPPTPEMTNKMVQITVEILDILAIATKETKQNRMKRIMKKVVGLVVGRTDLEVGMKKLKKLTNEEVLISIAQHLKVAHNIDKNMTEVNEGAFIYTGHRST